jgi:hypothetical protein
MMDNMPCGCGTLRTTGVGIWHQVSRRACAEVSAALEVSCGPVLRYQLTRSLPQTCAEVSAAQKFHFSKVKSCSILNAPPELQVLSGAPEKALAESESTVQSSRGAGSIWKYFEAQVKSTGASGRVAHGLRTD